MLEYNMQVTPAVQTVATPPVDVYVRPAHLKGLPRDVTLYQYEVCPFCCKVKAFLDYHKVCSLQSLCTLVWFTLIACMTTWWLLSIFLPVACRVYDLL